MSTSTVPEARDTRDGRSRGLRGDLVAAALALLVLGAALVVPLLTSDDYRARLYTGSPPLFGGWEPHVGPGTPAAVLVAVLVVLRGPALAQRLGWRPLLVTAYAGSLVWAFSLALVDGWSRGVTTKLTTSDEYLAEVVRTPSVSAAVRTFSDRILEGVPGSWTTHVAGHPPGALLVYLGLDRVGLGGGTWASVVTVAVGCSAVVAVLVTVRALATEPSDGEALARRAAPFLVLAPAAVWVAVSADGLFAGVTAWGVALLALSARRRVRSPLAAALGAGLLLGAGVFLSYGLALVGVVAVAVLVAARTARPLLPAALAALAVVGAFALAGFWWLDGYHLVQQRYYQGIGSLRPFSYWGWANVASLTCAVGLASWAGVVRALAPGRTGSGSTASGSTASGSTASGSTASGSERSGTAAAAGASSGVRTRLRALTPLGVLVAGAVLTVVIADLSGLSKAETERIWLPFAVWLLAATALLPPRHVRSWLAAQAVLALAVNHLVLTGW